MTKTEAIKILTQHQKWRKGAYQVATDPKMLSEAIEEGISALRILDNYCHCQKPFPNSKFGVFECMNCEKQML